MNKSIIVISILIFSLSISANGQLAVGYGTDGNTLSLSTNPQKKCWGELRVNTKPYRQAWSYSDIGITQGYLMVRIFSTKIVSFYSGAGIGVNLLSGGSDKWFSVNVPAGIRMNPFPSIPDLFLIGEYDPMIITSKDIVLINSVSLGFRYRLSKKE